MPGWGCRVFLWSLRNGGEPHLRLDRSFGHTGIGYPCTCVRGGNRWSLCRCWLAGRVVCRRPCVPAGLSQRQTRDAGRLRTQSTEEGGLEPFPEPISLVPDRRWRYRPLSIRETIQGLNWPVARLLRAAPGY